MLLCCCCCTIWQRQRCLQDDWRPTRCAVQCRCTAAVLLMAVLPMYWTVLQGRCRSREGHRWQYNMLLMLA